MVTTRKKTKQSKLLLVRRANILGTAAQIEEFDANFIAEQACQIPFRIERLDKLWEEFETVENELDTLRTGEPEFSEERSVFQDKYFQLKGSLTSKLAAVNAISTPTSTATPIVAPLLTTPSPPLGVRLPELKIPVFEGKCEEWSCFHDLFDSMIHKNPLLSNVQKLHYLRASVKGDAARIIQSLPISANNYLIAWKLLTDRFENKALLIKHHISALFSVTALRKESASALSELVDEFEKHVTILNTLEEKEHHWNSVLVEVLGSRLDPTTKKEWESQCADDARPSYENLVDFIHKRSRILQSLMLSQPSVPSAEVKQQKPRSTSHHSASEHVLQCPACKQAHYLFQCDVFRSQNPSQRFEFSKRHGLCINCLKGKHFAKNCSGGMCKFCGQRHHTLLHIAPHAVTAIATHQHVTNRPSQHTIRSQPAYAQSHSPFESHSLPSNSFPSSTVNSPTSSSRISTEFSSPPSVLAPSLLSSGSVNSNSPPFASCQSVAPLAEAAESTIFLSTALIKARDSVGIYHFARALLDSGSQSSFISESLCQRLTLKRTKINMPISGIGQAVVNVRYSVQLQIRSRFEPFNSTLECLVLPRLTVCLPTRTVDVSQWMIPKNTPLADPHFNVSQGVDLIIGAEMFMSLLEPKQIVLDPGLPCLQKTRLGFIVSGKAPTKPPMQSVCHIATHCSLDDQLQKFWEVEDFDRGKCMTKQEQYCEDHFKTTHTRARDGRYVVRLPVRQEMISQVGDTIAVAKRRFASMERRFQTDEKLRAAYVNFMTEYANLGHMEEVRSNVTMVQYFLPHHAIHRPESTTTKTRIVFDGSCKSTNRLSLNDLLYIGPTVQPTLLTIVLNFRLHRYVVSADIEKMYRQIEVHSDDRPLQQIVWRADRTEPLRAYQLNTVTYGTSVAPFLATRVLNQLALDDGKKYPLAAPLLTSCFYVDNLLAGNNDLETLIESSLQLSHLLKGGCFNLRQWCSNDPAVLTHIPEHLREPGFESSRELDQTPAIKTLGLLWTPFKDQFAFKVPHLPQLEKVTKRIILAEMSQLFDPLGLVGPIVISAKMLLQQLWMQGLDWDEEVPDEYRNRWMAFRESIDSLRELSVPRWVLASVVDEYYIHCFCDASEKGYGCSVYVVSQDATGKLQSSLLIAKSWVAPISRLSIPRLELCAALLGSQLINTILTTTNFSGPVTFWTDSAIVLYWIRSSNSTWKVFVSNRIAEIQKLTKGFQWRHVPTDHNPADRISRGCQPNEILNDSLWWNGPYFLLQRVDSWPNSFIEPSDTKIQSQNETKHTISLLSATFDDSIITRHSELATLLKKVAFCYRFVQNCKKQKSERNFEHLIPAELDHSLKVLVRLAQRICFPKETVDDPRYRAKSPLKLLNLTLDNFGLLRLKGRLGHLTAPVDTRFPMLLPAGHHLTSLIARSVHLQTYHAGPQLLLAALRQRFWPLKGKDLTNRTVRNCITCFRCKPAVSKQLMAPLPAVRITPAKVFENTGLDYCGPFYVRQLTGRGAPVKVWVAVFVCLVVKAVHLDIVFSISSSSCVKLLKRFVSRVGRVREIHCDNATTFVGANREVQEMREGLRKQLSSHEWMNACLENGITFRFIPPRAPHFGGLWEAAVKAFKHHFYRSMGTGSYILDDFQTAVAQITSVLNSRPITPLSNNPDDPPIALTPGHFLVGGTQFCLAEPDFTTTPSNRLKLFQDMQKSVQQFWKGWSKTYLQLLHNRPTKWNLIPDEFRIGTIVLLKKDLLPPMQWPLGRVVTTFPGPDGIVRVVNVRTAAGTFKRATTELCILPIDIDTAARDLPSRDGVDNRKPASDSSDK